MKPSGQLIQDPFFIFYDARSGSTFLANLLINYAKIAIPPESNFITSIFGRFPKNSMDNKLDLEEVMGIIERDRKFSDWEIDVTTIRKEAEDSLPTSIRNFILSICTMYREKNFPESDMFGIKKGSYARHFEKIREVFPKSKFIGLIRDGRAVFNSKKHSLYSKTGQPFETNPIRAANVWCENLQLLKEIKKSYQEDTLIIKYEKLVRDTDCIIRSVCKFLDTPYNPSSASCETHYRIPDRYGTLHKNIEKSPLVSRILAWKEFLSPAEIFAFESVAYDQLITEGYELINQVESLKTL